MYENVVKECEICQKTKPAPPRSRFSGVRAKEFGYAPLTCLAGVSQLIGLPGSFEPEDAQRDSNSQPSDLESDALPTRT